MTILWLTGSWGDSVVSLEGDAEEAIEKQLKMLLPEFRDMVGVVDKIEDVPAQVLVGWWRDFFGWKEEVEPMTNERATRIVMAHPIKDERLVANWLSI